MSDSWLVLLPQLGMCVELLKFFSALYMSVTETALYLFGSFKYILAIRQIEYMESGNNKGQLCLH